MAGHQGADEVWNQLGRRAENPEAAAVTRAVMHPSGGDRGPRGPGLQIGHRADGR